jgi:LPS O-antigen subunit length determinant protein (WzzB/FepE family)
LSSICTANKRDGSPCTLPSYGSSSLCWAHSPETAERRRRGQSRGGRSKPTKELISVKQRLSELADDVLEGNVDRADAAVTSQVLNVYLRAISLELKVREQQEFEERIEQIEQAIERQQSNRWGRSS